MQMLTKKKARLLKGEEMQFPEVLRGIKISQKSLLRNMPKKKTNLMMTADLRGMDRKAMAVRRTMIPIGRRERMPETGRIRQQSRKIA